MAQDQIAAIEAKLLQVASRVVGTIQLRCHQALTSANPVDLGHARSWWVPSIGSPTDETPVRSGSDDEIKAAASARYSANQAKAYQIAATYNVKLGPAFISNPVDYLRWLNAGTSSQAGAKWIERSIETAVASAGNLRL
jgi:hypothetical protein